MYMPVSFTLIRSIILVIAVFSQVYLFFIVRRAVLSSSKPEPLKSGVVWAIGLGMVVLSFLDLCALTRPMRWVEPSYLISIWFYYLPAIWVLGSVLSAAVLVSAQLVIFLGKIGLRGFRCVSGRTASPPSDPERRVIIQASLGVLAAAPLFITGYGALDEAKSFHVREISVPFGRKLRIALLSDIHSGIYMTRRDIRRCADMVTDLKPDLFFMTGDYISNSIRFLPACLEELSRVQTAYGTYACLGNHEHWHGDLEGFERIFLKNKIILLNNSHEIVNTSEGPLGVIGIEDLVAGDPDLEKAISRIEKGIPRILLSHRPEIFPQAASKGISLTLAGHYHGGQIALKLPGLKFSLANLHTHYTEGLFQIKDSYMYVTSGIGTTFTPVRLNSPPEITLLNLR
jgi:hypothetical protein